MGIMPGAQWRPIPQSNYSPGRSHPIIGVTVHHVDGSLASADGWFHNPRAGTSSHFGIGYDGTIYQWVDTDDVAYHACQANWTGWIGIENESATNNVDGPPTDAQIAAMGRIIAWLGIPAVPATSPSSGGVGYHRQFGGDCSVAWGQTSCPGRGFIDAIPRICAAAGGAGPQADPDGKKDNMIFKEENGKYWREGFGDFYEVPATVAVGAALNGAVIVPIKTAERIALGVSLAAQTNAALKKFGVIH